MPRHRQPALVRIDEVGARDRSNMTPLTPSSRPASRATVTGPALLLAAVTMTAAATAAAQSAPSDAPSVVVAGAERRDVTPSFFYVGRVEAVETVALVARVEGFLERRDFPRRRLRREGRSAVPDRAGPLSDRGRAARGRPRRGARHSEKRRGRLRTQGNPGQAQDPGALRAGRGPRRARHRPRRGAAGAGGATPVPGSTSPTRK